MPEMNFAGIYRPEKKEGGDFFAINWTTHILNQMRDAWKSEHFHVVGLVERC